MPSKQACLGALQRFRYRPLRIAIVTATTHPLVESAARSEFPPSRYRAYWLRVPVSPLALASALRSSQPGDGASAKQTRLRLSSSSTFLQSLSRSHLVQRTAGTVARRLSWASLPFGTSRTRGSTYRGLTSPASFRPQGLVTLSTVSSPRVRAGLVSCRQRPWDSALRSISLSKAIRNVPATDEPACRFSGCHSLGRILGPDQPAAASGL